MTASGTSGKTGTVKRTAALREASAAVVQCLYRLVKGCLLHTDASNESVTASSKAALEAIADCCRHGATDDVAVLFMGDAIFVNGAILRTSREAHAIAVELGTLLGTCNVKEITLARTIGPADVTLLGTRLADVWRDRSLGARFGEVTIPGVTTSAGKALDEEVEDTLKPSERVARTYAAAIMSVRGLLSDLQRGELRLPRRIKRVAQKIVAHADEDGRLLVSLASQSGPAVDASTVAAGTAILTVAMARQLTTERVLLSNAAMAALLFDAGIARLGAGMAGVARKLNDDELDAVPASSMVVLTAIGKLHPPARMRGALVYEAWHQRRAHRVGALYRGRRTQTVLSRILAVARAFCELRAAGPEGGLSIDDAIQVLMNRATDTTENAYVRLLVGALGIYPAGTMVELNTGELAVVMATPALPIDFVRPPVKVMYDRDARLLAAPFDVDLAAADGQGQGGGRFVLRAVNADDQQLKAMRAFVVAATAASRRASVVRDPMAHAEPRRPASQAVPTARPASQATMRTSSAQTDSPGTSPGLGSEAPTRPDVPRLEERRDEAPRRSSVQIGMHGRGEERPMGTRPPLRPSHERLPRVEEPMDPRIEVEAAGPQRTLESPRKATGQMRIDPIEPPRRPTYDRLPPVGRSGSRGDLRVDPRADSPVDSRMSARVDSRADISPPSSASRRGVDPRMEPDEPPTRGARDAAESSRRPSYERLPRTEPIDPRIDVVPPRRPSHELRAEASHRVEVVQSVRATSGWNEAPESPRRSTESDPWSAEPSRRPSQDVPRVDTPRPRAAMTPPPRPSHERMRVEAPAPTPPPWSEQSHATADRTNQVSWQEYAERLSKPVAPEPTPPPISRPREPTPPPIARGAPPREPTPPPRATPWREPTPPPVSPRVGLPRTATPTPMVPRAASLREPTPTPMAPRGAPPRESMPTPRTELANTPVPRRAPISRTDSSVPPPMTEVLPLRGAAPAARAERVERAGDRTSQVNWEQYTERLTKAARPPEEAERDELLAAFLSDSQDDSGGGKGKKGA